MATEYIGSFAHRHHKLLELSSLSLLLFELLFELLLLLLLFVFEDEEEEEEADSKNELDEKLCSRLRLLFFSKMMKYFSSVSFSSSSRGRLRGRRRVLLKES
jgi:hypothetical protein